jgi:pilus assembly protein Flp/PilA
MDLFKRFITQEEGQGLVEYALIIGLIAVVAIAALSASGTSIKNIFGSISGKLSSTAGSIS